MRSMWVILVLQEMVCFPHAFYHGGGTVLKNAMEKRITTRSFNFNWIFTSHLNSCFWIVVQSFINSFSKKSASWIL